MNIKENVPLAPLTTFGVGGPARYFVSIEKDSDVAEAFAFAHEKDLDTFIFGGGSNMVVSDNGFEGLVISIENKGIEVVEETDDAVFIKVASGEVWDDVVAYTVEHGWWGVENLSYIPGKMGAFAVQNVGAYGIEAHEVVEKVILYDRQEDVIKTFSNVECEFEYRNSIFKRNPYRYVILETILKVSKTPTPRTDYVDVKKYFAEHDISEPTIQQIREAIIDIRKRKFADPATIGTAGSFFLNLYISQEEYEEIHTKIYEVYGQEKADMFEEIKNKFPVEGAIKIPAAFIVDRICELKGTRVGNAVVSETQALAILNPEKSATSNDVLALIQKVREIVFHGTTIALELEPKLVGFTKEELDTYLTL